MNAMLTARPNAAPDMESTIDAALTRIPPLWPLTHFVAVNPYLGLASHRFEDACAMVHRATGVLPLQSPKEYLDALHEGTVWLDDLWKAADGEWTAERLIEVLEDADLSSMGSVLPTCAGFLDSLDPHSHWEVLVVDEISKWCAVAYDDNQTTWNSPWKSMDLFSAWRDAATHDFSPEANGLSGFRQFVQSLPHTADATIEHCMQLLEQPHVDPLDFMHRQLMTISGWAGYLQYRVREATMHGGESRELRDLLAIRLAYDAALFSAFVNDGSRRSAWRRCRTDSRDTELVSALTRWQVAYEYGYQRQLASMLGRDRAGSQAQRPPVQAVFCIDVRSERLRRHLESSLPGIQTLGFAGFFGFPISHQKALSERHEARCPVLLIPPLHCPEPLTHCEQQQAALDRKAKRAWKAFQNSATSCFSFVESFGLGFVAPMLGLGRSKPCCSATQMPALSDLPTATLAQMAEGALRNMSLTRNFARLVLICGHGSHSSNNPYASALDCGACGGHAGDVNARLAATSLNDPAIRRLLAEKGIVIPEDTVFIAGLHDTLSDEVTAFDLNGLPESHRPDWETLKAALSSAGRSTREERAESLGLGQESPETLDQAIRSRGTDISQLRPEWGLANNAALVVAPRSRTAGLNLKGRVFLHDYDAEADIKLDVLRLILSAPVVVASWINLQYYASRIDPVNFGSGDKALHNVLGGIGVMEGNGGDLRTGLPMQSIHDGAKFVHEPRRLSVFIEASRGSLTTVLAELPEVRRLFDGRWIHLIALEGSDSYRYVSGTWNQF